MPVRFEFCFNHLSDANLFVVLYVGIDSYNARIMRRLALVATPSVCVMAAIGCSVTFSTFMDVINAGNGGDSAASEDDEDQPTSGGSRSRVNIVLTLVLCLLCWLLEDCAQCGLVASLSFL